MKPVLADTSYYGALLSPADVMHEAAVGWARALDRPVVVTEFVLLELGNGCRQFRDRALFCEFARELRADPNVAVIPASSELLQAGLDLYRRRLDKQWSLTDCISFVVMERRGLGEALTADRHFEQAGFTALLRQGHDG